MSFQVTYDARDFRSFQVLSASGIWLQFTCVKHSGASGTHAYAAAAERVCMSWPAAIVAEKWRRK